MCSEHQEDTLRKTQDGGTRSFSLCGGVLGSERLSDERRNVFIVTKTGPAVLTEPTTLPLRLLSQKNSTGKGEREDSRENYCFQ